MKSATVFLLTLAVLGAFAKSQTNTFRPSGFDGGYGSSLPVLNTHIQTPLVENPTVNFPAYVTPTTISESRHCLQTLVRPQFHNEIISVPTIDRIVRAVHSNPIVEAIDCGSTIRTATISEMSPGGGNSSKGGDSHRNGLFRGFATNEPGSNGVNIGLPMFFTIQNASGRNPQGSSNNFSSNGRNNRESVVITK